MEPLEYIADSKAYKLVEKVASSDYWTLHKAVYDHGDQHDHVFIKIFNFNTKDDRYLLHPLLQEIFVAKKCCQHTNIVRSVHCYFKKQDQMCVVMPNYPKTPLPSISIFKHGLPVKIVAFVILETLKALDRMHEFGERLHGNLLSTNVFLDEQANVKLEFPTWLTNPDVDIYRSSFSKNKKCEFSMVGRLACDLFYGDVPDQKKRVPALFEDFVRFCGSSPGPDTINDLMSHPFLKKFCSFDCYQKDLKKLLKKKLHPRRSSLFLCT